MRYLLTYLFIFTFTTPVFASVIDLNSWTVSGGGNWTVANDGSNVFQDVNGAPGYFLSDIDYLNTEFNGSFGVETTSDDDFIGFVFGYNNSDDYLLFDWKQSTQVYNSETANEGFHLSRISGTDVNLWNHTGNDLTVLATDLSTTNGWADNASYDFTLDYTATNISIDIDGTNIFDLAGSFGNGKFGFYNYSQSDVRYQGFEQNISVPEPSSLMVFSTLLLALLRLKKSQA